jgi:hypothetical protein
MYPTLRSNRNLASYNDDPTLVRRPVAAAERTVLWHAPRAASRTQPRHHADLASTDLHQVRGAGAAAALLPSAIAPYRTATGPERASLDVDATFSTPPGAAAHGDLLRRALTAILCIIGGVIGFSAWNLEEGALGPARLVPVPVQSEAPVARSSPPAPVVIAPPATGRVASEQPGARAVSDAADKPADPPPARPRRASRHASKASREKGEDTRIAGLGGAHPPDPLEQALATKLGH